ncbi:MAG: serine hydrolase [Chloroflexi bacterium]|nr:serine hydrolase [Chloroflexota bacterium]MCC6894335.1 serine hydrolase [Anaerolineae bacterium]
MTATASLTAALETLLADNVGRVFPTCVLAVIKDGEWVLNRAWGTVEGQPATTETLFDLASVTKLFTVTAFLASVSAGAVALDDPLVKVVPEFGALTPRTVDGGQDPHSKVRLYPPEHLIGKRIDPALVTFRHLLTHTSGLPAWRDVYNAAGPAPTPPDQPDPLPRAERWANGLQAMFSYPFVGIPGERVVYSDIGLLLLGEAVSRLGNAPLDQVIQQRVIAPLGLTTPRFNPVREGGLSREQIAPTEDDPLWRKRRVWGEVHDENACGLGGVAGHAGLFATALDVATFGQAWLNNPQTAFGISTSVATEAQHQQAETDGARRGLGFALKAYEGAAAGDLFSPNTYGHTGFTGTSLWIDPDNRLVVACLTNSVYPGRGKPGTLEFRRAVHDLLARELNH